MFRVLWFALLVSALSFAAKRPTIPTPGEDTVLTQGLSAKQFFANRKQDASCQEELQAARTNFEKQEQALKNLVASSASSDDIDSQEETTQSARADYLTQAAACGPCATRPLEKRNVQIGGETEHWYITDGSCFLDQDATKAMQTFENAEAVLLNTKHYSKPEGGFSSVLSYLVFNNETGEVLPGSDRMPSSPFYAYIAIEGPTVPLFGRLGFDYLFKNEFEERTQATGKDFFIKFNSVDAPVGWSQPDVHYTTASGQQESVTLRHLAQVQGMFYADSHGYFRYYTAGNFGYIPPIADDFAQTTLLNTLLQLTERSQ